MKVLNVISRVIIPIIIGLIGISEVVVFVLLIVNGEDYTKAIIPTVVCLMLIAYSVFMLRKYFNK